MISSDFKKQEVSILHLKNYHFALKMENTTETNTSFTPNPLTVLQIALGVFCFAFALIGIVSNIAMILIFKQKDLKIRFNCLIILRAVFDLITIICYLMTAMLYFIGSTGPFCWFVCACAFNCSAFTMTNIALERYLVLCKEK